MEIRKCTVDEAAAVGEFYDGVVKFMNDNNVNYPKWLYKIFPTTSYAVDAARAGTQFICTDGEKILAAFVLSENPEGDYSKVAWSQNLSDGEFLVLHAFAVAPNCQRRGLGKKVMDFCVNYTVEKNYRALRLDIVPTNFPAKKLYEACGFKFVGAADLGRTFSGIPQFCCYERIFQMNKVLVDLGAASYEIFIGENILSNVGKFISEKKFTKVLVVTQKNIFDAGGRALIDGFDAEKISYTVATIPDGETSKNLREAENLYTRAIEFGLDRKSVVVALGGGVVGDLGGFVAATFLRGISLIQIPTTLLAQVDSAVGGKTAVNHALGKNLIGAFHQPRAVFIDLNFLTTLPEREIKSGLGEVVKYGVISDEKFFAYLEDNAEKILQRDLKTLAHVVKRSCEIKAEVVGADERESGLRRILNFGHTLAHAVEEQSGYKKFRHGEAVAIGMVGAAKISCELGKTSAANVERLENLLQRFDMVTRCDGLDAEKLYAVTFRDKKTVGGAVNWVLMKNFGDVKICGDVPADIVKKIFRGLCNGN